MTKQTKQTEKDQELNLDALDHVSGGTKNDRNSSIKDAIKKAMDMASQSHDGVQALGR